MGQLKNMVLFGRPCALRAVAVFASELEWVFDCEVVFGWASVFISGSPVDCVACACSLECLLLNSKYIYHD